MIELVLFDLDRSFISSYMDSPGQDYHIWELLPGRAQAIAALLAQDCEVGFVTNQGSVAFDIVAPEEFEQVKIPLLLAEMRKQGMAFKRAVFNPVNLQPDRALLPIWVCYHHPKGQPPYNDPVGLARRKPSGAMIEEALRFFEVRAENCLFVGDSAEDEGAAKAAGVDFAWAQEYF